MLSSSKITNIMDASVKDISKRVAKIDVSVEAEDMYHEPSTPYTLFVTTSGDLQLTLSLCTDKSVLKTITENMKRGQDASDEDILIYTSEYFNILCGHIVSSINRNFLLKTDFSVPQVVEGICFRPKEDEIHHQRFYNYNCGTVKFETLNIENKNN